LCTRIPLDTGYTLRTLSTRLTLSSDETLIALHTLYTLLAGGALNALITLSPLRPCGARTTLCSGRTCLSLRPLTSYSGSLGSESSLKTLCPLGSSPRFTLITLEASRTGVSLRAYGAARCTGLDDELSFLGFPVAFDGLSVFLSVAVLMTTMVARFSTSFDAFGAPLVG